MKDCRQLVRGALEATQIVAPTRYRWFEQLNAPLAAETEAAMAPEDARRFLVHALKMRLYGDFYCPGHARPALDSAYRPPRATAFLEALSAANQGHGSCDPGWRVVRHEHPHIVVERHGLQVWVRPDEVCTAAAALGEVLSVKLPKELLRLSPGFYMALGDHEFPADGANQLRFYWNLQPGGAVALMRVLTTRLNDAGLAYRFKVVSDAEAYSRADAGVLYGARADAARLAALVEDTYLQVRTWMKPATPAFTEERAAGLGFAESPDDLNESFGTARCELLAEALLEAHECGASGTDARFAVVERRFAAAGLSLQTPWLNPVVAPRAGP
jgi:hypothetical protein